MPDDFRWVEPEEPEKPDDGKKSKRRRRDDRALLLAGVELWRSPDGIAHASVPMGGHMEHMRVGSREFRSAILMRWYAQRGVGLSGQAQAEVVSLAEARALASGEVRRPWRRYAEHDGMIFVDLGGSDPKGERRAVEIGRGAWRVVDADDVPVAFLRGPDALPLPEPVGGGEADAEALRPFVNVGESVDALGLCWAWMLCAARPYYTEGAYPLAVIHGDQGSGKSWAVRTLQALIDPCSLTGRALPREERDLFITANNRHLLAFDNLSSIGDTMSDCLSRIATGGGFSARTLHSDSDETIFVVLRPILLNGIPSTLLGRPDLADRALRIELRPLDGGKRRDQATIAEEFRAKQPALLGVLYDGLAAALQNLHATTLSDPIRMFGAMRWAEAAASALGYDPDRLANAWRTNREEADREALSVDDVALAVVALVVPQTDEVGNEIETKSPFVGSMTELYGELGRVARDGATKSPLWPKNANGLGSKLRRIAPGLRSIYRLEITHRKGGADGTRQTTIRRV